MGDIIEQYLMYIFMDRLMNNNALELKFVYNTLSIGNLFIAKEHN